MTEPVPGFEYGEINFFHEQDIEAFANKFSLKIPTPLIIWLKGDLGAGKTTFARSLIQALGYEGRVKSPSYGLLEQYQAGRWQVIHMDLYRISDPSELEFLALEDLLDEASLLLIEWPEKGEQCLPQPDFIFEFFYRTKGRKMQWTACSAKAQVLFRDKMP